MNAKPNQEHAMQTARFTHTDATVKAYTSLAADLDRHADAVDALAERVKTWDLSPRMALGMLQEGAKLRERATRFYQNALIGPNTKASYRNEASVIGGSNGYSGSTGIEYALMYALGEVEKYRTGQYVGDDDTRMARSTLAVKASGMRCHASSCRVVAQIAREVAAGEYHRIG